MTFPVLASTRIMSVRMTRRNWFPRKQPTNWNVQRRRLPQLLEEQAADLVLEEMNALPSKDNLTLDDEVALAGAEAHYNALSDAQKEYLNGKSTGKCCKTW